MTSSERLVLSCLAFFMLFSSACKREPTFGNEPARGPSGAKDLGTFELKAGRAAVQDPGYGANSNLAVNLTVSAGRWRAWITKSNQDKWGERVASLVVGLEGTDTAATGTWEAVGIVGVDSGQAGVFAPEHIDDPTVVPPQYHWKQPMIDAENPWYSLVCDQTLALGGGVIPAGVASSSGIGDGAYEASVARTGDAVTAIRIVYLTE